MLKIFKKQSIGTNQPKPKETFAVQTGDYAGEMLIFVESYKGLYGFLSIPAMVNRDIPVDKFNFAIENSILEKVEELPKNIYNMCIAQYKKNKKL